MVHLKTFQDVAQYPTPSDIDALIVYGRFAFGDCEPCYYRRVASQPAHGGFAVSATGGFFELSNTIVNPVIYGAVGDGATDDTVALAAMASHARARGFLDWRENSSKVYAHKNPFFLGSIPRIKIDARGVGLINIKGTSSPDTDYSANYIALALYDPWSNFGMNNRGWSPYIGGPNPASENWAGDKIATALAGSLSVSVLGSPTVAPGDKVFIFGLFGMAVTWLPAPRIFEFNVVESIAGDVVTLRHPLENSYDQAWPDSASYQYTLGAPRMVSLNRPDYTQIERMDIRGLHCLKNPAWTTPQGLGPNNGMASFSGADTAYLEDITVDGGIYINIGGDYHLKRVSGGYAETDKGITSVVFEDCTFDEHAQGVSCKRQKFKNCRIKKGFGAGAIDEVIVEGGEFQNGANQGGKRFLIGQCASTKNLVVSGTRFTVNNAMTDSIIDVTTKGRITVKAIVNATTWDIGLQADYEADNDAANSGKSWAFLLTQHEGMRLYAVDGTVAISVTRLPYSDGAGRMRIEGVAEQLITAGQVLYSAIWQNMTTSDLIFGGPYAANVTATGAQATAAMLTTVVQL